MSVSEPPGGSFKRVLFLLCMLVSAMSMIPVSAQEGRLHAADFAYGYMLEVDGDGAIYGLSLPEDVYRNVTRADLGDVRVFNSEGRIVPMAIRPQPVSARTTPAEVALPLFPLYVQDGGTANTMALHITTDTQGAIIDISGQQQNETTHVDAYLLDASQLGQTVKQLRLHWSGAPASFVTRVSVQGSDDLTHWHPLVDKATLASLAFNARQLRRDVIVLSPSRDKYLRIQWPAGRRGVVLKAVEAQLSNPDRDVPRQWLRVPGQLQTAQSQVKSAAMVNARTETRTGMETDAGSDQGDIRTYFYDSGGFFPVDRVQLVLPRRNALLRVELASRASPTQPWKHRFTGVIYHFSVEGTALNNSAVAVARLTDRYWRVRLLSPTAWQGREAPVLMLGWRPDQLLFVASGEAPFRLVYGDAGVHADRAQAGALLHALAGGQRDDIIKAAQPGSRIELGGAARLHLPGPPVPWRQWLLWAVLVLGVLALGWMAWRLARQMSRDQGQ